MITPKQSFVRRIRGFIMSDEANLLRQQDLREHDQPLPDTPLLYFKYVSVATSVLAREGHDPRKICEIVDEQDGFFLIGESSTQVRNALHELVDSFMDAIEKKEC